MLVSPKRSRLHRQHGVALITTMLLLLLLTAMSLTMVLSVSSDMLLTGYYGNYRGSFYAADSGLNIARQQVVASLNSSIPVPFDPAVRTSSGDCHLKRGAVRKAGLHDFHERQ